MPATAGPNLGLQRGWTYREDGWDDEMYDNLNMLDSIAHLAVIDKDLTAPPGSPANGARYIVGGPTPTGAWAGHVGEVAVWLSSAWKFFTPKTGWTAFVIDEGTIYVRSATAWSVVVGQAHLNANLFTSIQAAIDALPAVGGTVYIPGGVYTLTATLYTPCDRPCHLFGVPGSNIANVMQNMGTVLKWTANVDMLRVRGNDSSVRNLVLWNTSGGAAANEEAGRGLTVGRRSLVDPHPHPGTSGTDTELVKGSSDVLKNCLFEDLWIKQAPGWGIMIPGFARLSDETTDESNKVDNFTLSIFLTFRRVNVLESNKYGNIFVGGGNTTVRFEDCVSLAVGTTQVSNAGYYAYSFGSVGTVFDHCTFEGFNALGNKDWVRLWGCEDARLSNCWFEEATKGTSTDLGSGYEHGYFVHFGVDCRNPIIDQPHFVRSGDSDGRLRLIKCWAESSGNVRSPSIIRPYATSVDAVVSAVGDDATGVQPTYVSDDHIVLGTNATYQHGNVGVVLINGLVFDVANVRTFPLQVKNQPLNAFIVQSQSLKIPAVTNLDYLENSQRINGALVHCWSKKPGDALGLMHWQWGGTANGEEAGMRLFDNVPSMTKAQRAAATWMRGDIVYITDAGGGHELQIKVLGGGAGAAKWAFIPWTLVTAGADY